MDTLNFYNEIQLKRIQEQSILDKTLFTQDELLMKGEKNEFSTEERKKLADKKMAMKDLSYPIRNRADLENAIQAIGRAKDYEKAKRWIIKRARELNSIGMLPADWKITKAVADDLNIIETAIEAGQLPEWILEKGHKGVLGEKRTWGKNEYEKTTTGWKLVSHKGKEFKEDLESVKKEVEKKIPEGHVGAIVEKEGKYNFFFPKKGEYKVGDKQKSDHVGDEKYMGKIVHIVEPKESKSDSGYIGSEAWKSVVNNNNPEQLKNRKKYTEIAIEHHKNNKDSKNQKFFEEELALIDKKLAKLDKK